MSVRESTLALVLESIGESALGSPRKSLLDPLRPTGGSRSYVGLRGGSSGSMRICPVALRGLSSVRGGAAASMRGSIGSSTRGSRSWLGRSGGLVPMGRSSPLPCMPICTDERRGASSRRSSSRGTSGRVGASEPSPGLVPGEPVSTDEVVAEPRMVAWEAGRAVGTAWLAGRRGSDGAIGSRTTDARRLAAVAATTNARMAFSC